ncbi:MAG: hypothetical protein KDA65_15040 [Planctomycetaceae bacterium]|nr:hypothetical protein [Planctomycetaceae bacterium]
MKKRLVAVIALLCWGAAGIFYVTNPESQIFLASSVRIGLVMSAIWLALPSKEQAAAWAKISSKWWVTLGVGLVIGLIRPKLAPGILLLFAVIGFLWKPKVQKPSSQPQPSQTTRESESAKSPR